MTETLPLNFSWENWQLCQICPSYSMVNKKNRKKQISLLNSTGMKFMKSIDPLQSRHEGHVQVLECLKSLKWFNWVPNWRQELVLKSIPRPKVSVECTLYEGQKIKMVLFLSGFYSSVEQKRLPRSALKVMHVCKIHSLVSSCKTKI